MTTQSKTKQVVKIFISYSHADERYRRSLETHLSILRRNGLVSEWHDRKIVAGQEWQKEIDTHLKSSDLFLLLVSPDFIASDYCYGKEVESAMELHEAHKSIVVPIIVRPSNWMDTPFAKLLALPKDAEPITTWSNEDEAWLNVENGLKATITYINETRRTYDTDRGLTSLRDLLAQEVHRIDTYFDNDKACTGISTGIDALNSAVDGIHDSDLFVVAGRPQMGRTDLVLNIAMHAALKEHIPVAFYSLRLSGKQLVRKITASLGMIASHRLSTTRLTDGDWPRLSAAVSVLVEAAFLVDDRPVLPVQDLVDSIEKFQKVHNGGLVVVDAIENVVETLNPHTANPATICGRLRAAARELKLPIMLTLSLPRAIEHRYDRKPNLSDLGDWDVLIDAADCIIFLYRDEDYPSIDPDCPRETQVIVAKNNYGQVGTVKLLHLKEYSRFYDHSAAYSARPSNEDPEHK